jgi:hypothetical protein
MSDKNQVTRYHAKFLEDINSILEGSTVQSHLLTGAGAKDIEAGSLAGQ